MKTIIERIEPSGFIKEYIAYASQLTDASIEFKLAGALAVLSTVCGSKIIYPGFGGQRQWPNLYILLIAPSAFDRKSTTVRIAKDLIAEIDSQLILSNEQTREKFLNVLKTTPNTMWAILEFSSVLAVWNRDWAGGFRETIVDLFDCQEQYVRETLKDGRMVIKKPALNIFAASTLDWLKEKLTEGDLRGGLMGRFIIFPPGAKTSDPGLKAEKPPHPGLLHHLKGLRSLQQAWIDISVILKEYTEWDKKVQDMVAREFTPELSGFQSRISSHVLKLAVLFCISDNAEPQKKYTITSEHLNKAIILGKWLTAQSVELANTGFIKSKTEDNIQRLIKMASRDGGVQRSIAIKNMHLTSREFEIIAKTSVERRQIRVETLKGVRKPTLFYVADKAVDDETEF